MIFYHNYEKYMGIMNCVSNWVQEGEAEIGRFSFKGMPQRLAWSVQLWQNLNILPHVNDVCMKIHRF